ncbi:ras guanine nucleotide exchange factor F-like isoform X2 [Pseudophryne corroboree]|uniref:ras guanine nucleotide exchange factor F-like isoform X2 n=1 Tax=Pseudophryne corroboree TaxID=495146 RepID=UPI0030818103
MINGSADCAWEPMSRRERFPCDRFKHAGVLYNGFVYIHGGRQDYLLGDFWRYNIAVGQWEQLPSSRQAPDKLEGHSMVAHEGVLYVFGGMVDFGANRQDTPLWMYGIETRKWYEFKPLEGQTRPTNRKGHSAVVYQSGMFIYGGYFDIEGAVEEFWVFYFDTQKWSALSPRTRGLGPGPRYGHSSVTYNAAMYLFGGLKNMAEQNDFWRFDFRRHNWSNIKTSSTPPRMVGHASVIHQGCLWIVGGGLPSRSPTNNLWKYHFTSRSWKKFSKGMEIVDCAKMYHCVIAMGCKSRIQSTFPGGSVDTPETDVHYSLQTWGANKVASITDSEIIEMKTFKERPVSPVLCSCSSKAQMDECHLLASYENESFTYHGEETEADYQQTALECRTQAESQDVLLVIGGKPLAKHCKISMCQIKMGVISDVN